MFSGKDFFMNNSYKSVITFLVAFAHLSLFCGDCDSETQNKIEQATPFSLFGMIDTAKISAFDTEDLIKNNLNPEKIRAWDAMFACDHLYITHLADHQHTFESYKQYCTDMDKTNDFIKNSLRTLHKKFASVFEKKRSLMPAFKNGLSSSDYQYIHQLKREITSHEQKMKSIIGVALQKIDIGLPTPDEWYTKNPPSIKDLFPCYKEFFNSYYEAKNSAKKERLSTQELLYFITITNVFNSKCLKTMHHDEVSKAAAIVDVLKKMQYQLEHEAIKSISVRERTRILTASKEIIEGLQTAYPHMITEFHFKKLSLTNDKASIIIFAQAKSLLSVLDDLVKKINQLLTKKSE